MIWKNMKVLLCNMAVGWKENRKREKNMSSIPARKNHMCEDLECWKEIGKSWETKIKLVQMEYSKRGRYHAISMEPWFRFSLYGNFGGYILRIMRNHWKILHKTVIWSYLDFKKITLITIDQESANFFCQEPDNKYFRLGKP